MEERGNNKREEGRTVGGKRERIKGSGEKNQRENGERRAKKEGWVRKKKRSDITTQIENICHYKNF